MVGVLLVSKRIGYKTYMLLDRHRSVVFCARTADMPAARQEQLALGIEAGATRATWSGRFDSPVQERSRHKREHRNQASAATTFTGRGKVRTSSDAKHLGLLDISLRAALRVVSEVVQGFD